MYITSDVKLQEWTWQLNASFLSQCYGANLYVNSKSDISISVCSIESCNITKRSVCFNMIINQYNSSSIMSFVLGVTQHCMSLISVRYVEEINMWIWDYSSGDLYKNFKLCGVLQERELILNSLTRSVQWTKAFKEVLLSSVIWRFSGNLCFLGSIWKFILVLNIKKRMSVS